MNYTDKEFYDFLISLPESVYDNWLETASDEDLERADRVFDEVKFKNLDTVTDLTEAQNVLKRFTLGA